MKIQAHAHIHGFVPACIPAFQAVGTANPEWLPFSIDSLEREAEADAREICVTVHALPAQPCPTQLAQPAWLAPGATAPAALGVGGSQPQQNGLAKAQRGQADLLVADDEAQQQLGQQPREDGPFSRCEENGACALTLPPQLQKQLNRSRHGSPAQQGVSITGAPEGWTVITATFKFSSLRFIGGDLAYVLPGTLAPNTLLLRFFEGYYAGALGEPCLAQVSAMQSPFAATAEPMMAVTGGDLTPAPIATVDGSNMAGKAAGQSGVPHVEGEGQVVSLEAAEGPAGEGGAAVTAEAEPIVATSATESIVASAAAPAVAQPAPAAAPELAKPAPATPKTAPPLGAQVAASPTAATSMSALPGERMKTVSDLELQTSILSLAGLRASMRQALRQRAELKAQVESELRVKAERQGRLEHFSSLLQVWLSGVCLH